MIPTAFNIFDIDVYSFVCVRLFSFYNIVVFSTTCAFVLY